MRFERESDGFILEGTSDYNKLLSLLTTCCKGDVPQTRGVYVDIGGSGYFSSNICYKSTFAVPPTEVFSSYARTIIIDFCDANNGTANVNLLRISIIAHGIYYGRDLKYYCSKLLKYS